MKTEDLIENDDDIVFFKRNDLTISTEVVKREIIKYWDRDYINQCINQVSNPKYKMFMKFLWMTGLRVSEAINIKKKDIDFKSYLITCRWLKNRKYYERVLPMHPLLKDVLELYVSTLKLEDKVFPFTRQRAFQITQKYLRGNPHKLRHSFAVNWLKCGGDIVMLHKMLGHKYIQTTMCYLQLVPVDQGKELIKIQF